jgi:hypothetical protein
MAACGPFCQFAAVRQDANGGQSRRSVEAACAAAPDPEEELPTC